MATTAQVVCSTELRRVYGSHLTSLDTATVVRPIDPSQPSVWSQHAYGNAINVYASQFYMAVIAGWLVLNANRLNVAHVIYNRRSWNSSRRTWVDYTGRDPHTTHVHVDFHPQWTGTPPGHPVGAPSSTLKTYQLPPVLNYPYPIGWRIALGTMLVPILPWGTDPADLSLARLRSTVIEFNRRHAIEPYERVATKTWQQLEKWETPPGRSDKDVAALQWFLIRYSYLRTSVPSRVYDVATQQAVARVETAAGLRQSLTMNPQLWRALEWGPTAWSGQSPPDPADTRYVRPADGQPTGSIEHSWEPVLQGLRPHVARAGDRVNGAARTLRQLVR